MFTTYFFTQRTFTMSVILLLILVWPVSPAPILFCQNTERQIENILSLLQTITVSMFNIMQWQWMFTSELLLIICITVACFLPIVLNSDKAERGQIQSKHRSGIILSILKNLSINLSFFFFLSVKLLTIYLRIIPYRASVKSVYKLSLFFS